MPVAKMTVNTMAGEVDIMVEILGNGPRPGTIWVRALRGCRPFTKTSHGGPYQDDTAMVYLPSLREIHNSEARAEAVVIPSPIIQEDWFLESQYEDRTWIDENG